jgi:hypothetical protein
MKYWKLGFTLRSLVESNRITTRFDTSGAVWAEREFSFMNPTLDLAGIVTIPLAPPVLAGTKLKCTPSVPVVGGIM